MRTSRWAKAAVVTTSSAALAAVLAAACGVEGASLDGGREHDGADEGAGGSGPVTSGSAPGGFAPSGGSGGGAAGCPSSPESDLDGDGWTPADGDCNDCDPNVNPGAVEVPTDAADPNAGKADEDCDGQIDESAESCDAAIAYDDFSPMLGAKTLELCAATTANAKKWGVVSAQWVRADGSSALPTNQMGMLDAFGPNVKPLAGARLLALSTGRARLPGHQDACLKHSCTEIGKGTAPPGFPQDVPGCPPSTSINDDIGLELVVRAPSNATGYKFNFSFYSFEFPEWICKSFNDQFIALVSPAPPGAINGNIAFDKQQNPVSVNIAFFDICKFNTSYPQYPCSLGTAELQGTGFDTWNDAGATGWLETSAPIDGGATFTIRFAIWDSNDSAFDSTILIDNFRWVATPGTVVETTRAPL
jgi:hypothetical protein